MTLLTTKRYYPESAALKTLIKYFWLFESAEPVELNHKILPVANIDLVFNFLSPTLYEKCGITHNTPGNAFFSGLRSEHIVMKQRGPILTIGESPDKRNNAARHLFVFALRVPIGLGFMTSFQKTV